MYFEMNRILTSTVCCFDHRIVDAVYVATSYANIRILIEVDYGIRTRIRKVEVYVTTATRIEPSLLK